MRQRLLLVPVVLTLLLLAPAFPAVPPARAQPADGAPRIHATMFHHIISWTAAPGDRFEVTLNDAAGKEKGYVWAWADAEGLVRVKLVARTNDFAYQRLEPGDRLLIASFAGPELLDLEIPDASADVTDDGRRIVGRAPAGTALAVELEPRGTAAPFTADRFAGADGAFALDLPDDARREPGEGGRVTFTHPDGHVFDIQFARRQVEIQLDSAHAEARFTLQTPIGIRRMVVSDRGKAPGSLRRDPQTPNGPTADGRATFSDDARFDVRRRITAGTVVTISQQGGPLRRTDNFVRTMPDLAIRIDGPRRLAGHGPPGAALEVEVLPPEVAGESATSSVRFPVVADAQGAFVLALPESVALAAGWRAVVRQDLGDGITVLADVTLPRFRLSVHAARLDTHIAPFQTMTVTLLARDGNQRAQEVVRADEAGAVELHLDNGETHPGGWDVLEPFRPGDTVEIDLGSGDPTRLVVPMLTGGTDPDAELIRGRAAPGASLTARVYAEANVIQQGVIADAAGEYVVDLGGAVDFEPGVQSIVTWTDPRGHEFYVLTAPLRLVVTPGWTYIDLAPTFGYAITATLVTADGIVAGRGGEVLTEIGDPRDLPSPVYHEGLLIWFYDQLGGSTRYQAGDRIEVHAGGDVARVTVLPLDGRLHVEDDLVVGRTVPGVRLQLDTAYYDATNVTAMLTADANGYFSHSFRGDADIRYNSSLLATVFTGRHRVRHTINGPGFLMEFSAARVSGSVEPDVDLRARLGPETAPRADAAARTNRAAAFTAILRDPAGEPVEPRAGDPLAILAPAAQLMREIMWILPRLTLAFDPISGTTHGTAEPDALLEVSVGEAIGYPGVRRPRLGDEARDFPRIAPDGSWSVDKSWPPVPGARIEARMILPSGHVALRSVTHPILSVQHGGSAVCGLGHPHSRVVVSLRDAVDREIARAGGRADAEGRFDLRFTDAAGKAVRTAEGMRASADIGGVAAEVPLGPLEVDLDPATGEIAVRVLPKALFEVYFPARNCLAWDDGGVWRELTGRTGYSGNAVVRAGDDGTWSRVLAWDMKYLAVGMDAATYTPDGHRTYRAVHLPLSGLAYVGTDRLVGRAPPDASVELSLRAPDGTARYQGTVVADERGHFDLRLSEAGGAAIRLNPGDRINLMAGSDQAALTVEPLSFDYSPEVGIQGQAPPERTLRLGLAFRQDSPGYFDYFDLRSDAAGRFTLLASDLSPRGPWTFTDVTAIDIALPQAGGHATVAEWRAEERLRLLYLPLTER
jgi:hypothetical protein